MIWELEGVTVGHWSDPRARTGCTVVLLDPAAVASGEVRGAAPATREFALLDPTATAERIDAVVLSGGSAFGLAAAQGAVEHLESLGRGFPTSVGPVPIVVGMSLSDLAVGNPGVRPGPDEGRVACLDAPSTRLGAVGAGTGATSGTWRGADSQVPSGLGGAIVHQGGCSLAVLVAANPWGDIAPEGAVAAPWPDPLPDVLSAGSAVRPSNTTIGVVVTDATIDKVGCHQVARAAHDGLARAITPPHSGFDGDAFVALSTARSAPVSVELLRLMAVAATERAIRSLAAPL